MIGASAPRQLPRDEKQVTNLRKRERLKGLGLGPMSDADDLFVIMQQAQAEDPSSKFVRGIHAVPESLPLLLPMIVNSMT